MQHSWWGAGGPGRPAPYFLWKGNRSINQAQPDGPGWDRRGVARETSGQGAAAGHPTPRGGKGWPARIRKGPRGLLGRGSTLTDLGTTLAPGAPKPPRACPRPSPEQRLLAPVQPRPHQPLLPVPGPLIAAVLVGSAVPCGWEAASEPTQGPDQPSTAEWLPRPGQTHPSVTPKSLPVTRTGNWGMAVRHPETDHVIITQHEPSSVHRRCVTTLMPQRQVPGRVKVQRKPQAKNAVATQKPSRARGTGTQPPHEAPRGSVCCRHVANRSQIKTAE